MLCPSPGKRGISFMLLSSTEGAAVPLQDRAAPGLVCRPSEKAGQPVGGGVSGGGGSRSAARSAAQHRRNGNTVHAHRPADRLTGRPRVNGGHGDRCQMYDGRRRRKLRRGASGDFRIGSLAGHYNHWVLAKVYPGSLVWFQHLGLFSKVLEVG